MKNKLGLLAVISLLATSPLLAVNHGMSDFDAANQAYAARQYDDAIRIYENLLQNGGLSASVYYNLSNAYYLKGEIGKAVLGYQRALMLEPNAADIAANLAALRQVRGLSAPDVPWWERPLLVFSLDAWAWLSFMSLTVAMLGVLARAVWLNVGATKKCPHRFFYGMTTVGGLVLLLAVGGVFAQNERLDRQVVMIDAAPLKVSPFANAGDLASLKEGDLVKPLKRHQDFTYIKSVSGQKGWVSSGSLQAVTPTM